MGSFWESCQSSSLHKVRIRLPTSPILASLQVTHPRTQHLHQANTGQPLCGGSGNTFEYLLLTLNLITVYGRFLARQCVYNALVLSSLWTSIVLAQSDTLGLGDGFLTFNLSSVSAQIVKDSQTLYSLQPGGSAFDFVPSDVMSQRAANGNYHLGDITFRARLVGSKAWSSGDSSAERRNLTALHVMGSTLAAANLAPTLPSKSLLNITRRWVDEDGQFQLLFDVTNSQNASVEIGALGAALEFNNVCLDAYIIDMFTSANMSHSQIFSGRSTEDTNEKCSLFDPYIGAQAGYVQVGVRRVRHPSGSYLMITS